MTALKRLVLLHSSLSYGIGLARSGLHHDHLQYLSEDKIIITFCDSQELHAHLNGSISTDTLQKLSARKSSSDEKASDLAKLAKWKKLTENREQRSLEEYGYFILLPQKHTLI